MDPSRVSDPLFVADPEWSSFDPWTQEKFDALVASKGARL